MPGVFATGSNFLAMRWRQTHNTTFSRHFGLANFRHPFMFARRLDQRWR